MNSRIALRVALCAAPAAWITGTSFAQAAPALPPGVVATVDGHPVRSATIEDRLWREIGQVYLDYTVNQTIVRQEAARRGITVSDDELRQRMAEYKAQFITAPGHQPRDWEDFTRRFGLKNVEQQQRDDLILRKIGDDEAKNVALTPEEKAQVLHDLDREAHKAKARQVLIGVGGEFGGRSEADAQARAEEVRTKLAGGASWDEIAKEYSDDVSTRDRGGELGFFTREQMVKPLEDLAFSAKPDDKAIQVIRVPAGFAVVQVEERQDTTPTQEATDKAMADTLKRKQDIAREVSTWYPRIQKNYKVTKHLPYER